MLEVISNLPVPLDAITKEDVVREGFPTMLPHVFVTMFCKNMGCTRNTIVNRIEFKYVPEHQ